MSKSQKPLVPLETLAAALDGRLEGEERAEVLAAIDADPASYEVLVEAARLQESQSGSTADPVATVARRGSKLRWMHLAALVVLALGVTFFLAQQERVGGAGLPLETVADLGDSPAVERVLEADWFEQGWVVTRGLTATPEGAEEAFRLGVRAVDLDVALGRDKPDDAAVLLRRMEQIAHEARANPVVVHGYRTLREQLEGATELGTVRSDANRIDVLVVAHGGIDGLAYAFGKWCEAGKLAAAVGASDLLQDRAFVAFGREVATRSWDGEVQTALSRIDRLLGEEMNEPTLGQLRDEFQKIINRG